MTDTWLITGASRGLGLEIAKNLLEVGENVVATARDPDRIIAQLGGENASLLAVKLDVTNADDAITAVRQGTAKFGRIDRLVNNAGYGQFGWFEETTNADIRRQFEINVFGAFHVTRAVLPVMRDQRSGHIFVISSTAGFNSVEGSSIYSSSKFALEGWAQGLMREVSPFGIKVTIIGPGGFRTDFLDARSVAHAEPTIDDYREQVEAFTSGLDSFNHRQGGDPSKLPVVLSTVADMDNPPARLAVGSDAVRGFYHKLDQYRHEADIHNTLSASTDFDNQK
ncbi:MAG: SDR family NAD(P)-dependent oxidoreductase [Sinobacteraceae bacterium]|nr:SDR family NAD(P)-dependent oxidoreductase [Nevskiaceae bacterium]